MTLRAALVFVSIAHVACSFKAPGAGGGSGGGDAEVHDAAGEIDAPPGSCTAGAACDDMRACTTFDVCVDGECRGINTGACAGCASTCTAACGAGQCCTQSCPGGSCPTCPAGCSCNLSCGESRPCNLTCAAGSVCNMTGTNQNETDGNYSLTCESGSSCSLDCVGDDGACSVTCRGTASCLLDCRDKQAELHLCQIVSCPVPVTTCMGAYAGVKVCGRPCPT